MPLEKGFSSGHEIRDEERREHALEVKDEKKDEGEAQEEVKPNEAKEEEVIPNEAEEDKEDDDGDEEEEEEDSPDLDSGEESDEFSDDIDLEEVYKLVRCPICLGIIKKTRTMMECLHRFCKECIEKAMRMGNKECPACRTHCPSRRSLRDDPNFDAVIAILFPDIESYDNEELNEDEKARKKETQESIAQVCEGRKQKKGSTSRGRGQESRNVR